MCYTNTIDHKGITILISNCFGVGFDWKDENLKKAVENRDEAIFEILQWMVNGGAKLADDAYSFESDIAYSYSHAYEMLKHSTPAEIKQIYENPYASDETKKLIDAFYDGTLKNTVDNERQERKKPSVKKIGSVYLILAENGLYKIGKAKVVSERLKPFSVNFPMKWDLLHSFISNDYNIAETTLHQTFSDKRDIGEWFKLASEDVEYIKSIQDYQL